MGDGSLSYRFDGQARATELRVLELLARSRTFLKEIDSALTCIVESAGLRRKAFSCLVSHVREFDVGWPSIMSPSLRDCVVHEFEFKQGVDYTCDSYNNTVDGRTIPLVRRVRGLIIGAQMRGLSARWVASLVGASDSVLAEALSSLSLEVVPDANSSASEHGMRIASLSGTQ